jgi:hypothetical protein
VVEILREQQTGTPLGGDIEHQGVPTGQLMRHQQVASCGGSPLAGCIACRAVAAAFGIRLAGKAAVIGMARQRRLIESVKAVFAQLHATDFRIAPSASPPP